MKQILDNRAAWHNKFLGRLMPTLGHVTRPVYLSHGKEGLGPSYPVTLHHPPDWILEEALDGLQNAPETRTRPDTHHPDAQWVTLRTHPDDEGHPVRIHPDGSGRHVVAGGLAGRMNGLLMDGVLPANAYSTLSRRGLYEMREKNALSKQAEEAARDILRRRAAAGEGKLPVEVHQLPMSERQAVDYGQALHHLARAEQGFSKDTPDDYSLRRLSAYSFMDGSDPDSLKRQWPSIREGVLSRLEHAHPEGAKAQWVRQFAGENKEPIVVNVRSREAMPTVLSALHSAGRKAAIATRDLPYAHLLFSPPSGTAHLDALVNDASMKPPPGRQVHLVHYDTEPAEKEVDGKRFHSVHHLKIDKG